MAEYGTGGAQRETGVLGDGRWWNRKGWGWLLTVEEGNQFVASALGAQCKGDSRKTMNGVEPKENIIVL